MPHAMVFDVPVELSLPFVVAIGSDRMDPEREVLHGVIEEGDRVHASEYGRVDHQRAVPRRVIDGGVLKATNGPAVNGSDRHDIDIHLHWVSSIALN
jgi:hypothetical protein